MTSGRYSGSRGSFTARDGQRLVYRTIGEGRPFVLLHGFTRNGLQLLRYGRLAAGLAGRGYRVIIPDLRGHGDSSRSHDPAAYPPDVLTDDGLALPGFLELRDYDLGDYLAHKRGSRAAYWSRAAAASPASPVQKARQARIPMVSGSSGPKTRP